MKITPGSSPEGGPAAQKSTSSALAELHRDVFRGGPFLGRRALNALRRELDERTKWLREAGGDDPSLRSASEWMLDNHYLIERVFGQLERELPDGFQERLPRLRSAGRARVLAIAEVLHDVTSSELSLEGLERFLESYQDTTPLTIAELWALPALLRFVVLLRLRDALNADRTAEVLDAGTAAGRAVRALRLLAEVDWKGVFSRQSATERLLLEDPAEAYGAMDFETRDAYRRAVEEVAWSAGLAELDVTRSVLDHARQGRDDSRHAHVGFWLLGPGRTTLERSLGGLTRTLEQRLLAHPYLTLFGLLTLTQLALLAPIVGYLVWLDVALPLAALALILCWFPASVPTTTLVHWLLAKLIRPRLLPRLDFSENIPRRFRTLVVVPTLIGDAGEIEQLIARLEIHFLANRDPQLAFALLTDHVDTLEPPGPAHQQQLELVERGIARLNARWGKDGQGPFHLLHRSSRYNPTERKWMGWERKRGKLEELNRFLRGDRETTFETHIGDPRGLEGISFVITLDSDTQLPPGTAARLVGALAHPLNRPDLDGRNVRSGYTIIQPRVEISPRSARRSPFAQLFSGDTGIDIYTRAVSEVYQDLFGEGIYVGKGIYDVDGFQASLENRVPDNRILSHDLFEGIHGRAALATDIVVYEDYPPHYPAYLHRLHRWVRGDWQLLPWLLPRVPLATGGSTKNSLGLIDRFKIADNLRRSFLAPALMALLLSGWLLLPGHVLVWSLAAMLAPGAVGVWAILRTGSLPRQELGRWFLAVCFAPQEARVVLDGMARVMFRLLWTGRRLLEWTTAERSTRNLAKMTGLGYLRRLWVGPATAVAIGGALAWFSPAGLPWAAPWLLLWCLSPVIAWSISRSKPSQVEELDETTTRTLRRVGRRTWLFFEHFVGPRDRWLPPDHFQEQPRGLPAHRTSPTNIGMLLLSELAAYDLGYLGPAELVSWVSNTLDTLEQLETHRGHIYNWYDTRTLEPLEPRYVSAVDSGNLAGSLLALAIGLSRVPRAPPLAPAIRLGLRDTAELLMEAVEHWQAACLESGELEPVSILQRCRDLVTELDAREGADLALLEALTKNMQMLEQDILRALRSRDPISNDPALLGELRLWLDRLDHQLTEARAEALRYGAHLLGEPCPSISRIPRACQQALATVLDPDKRDELKRIAEDAATLRRRLHRLAKRARRLAHGMDFGFLYDTRRNLLHVGYNVSTDRLDPHHYDLLASEARLASYLAIVSGQVPVQHWFSLGRPVTQAGRGGRALLSWGGSMFEYLMPRLLMLSHEDTLLHQSCEAAVDRQIAYGAEHAVPWGISESSYAFLDGQEVYQYRAFGVPGLGLRRGLEEDLVIAPYASLLALPYRPSAVAANLAALTTLGMLGRFGFYDAVDFHRERAPGGRAALVRSYMAHHQGMILLAIDNYLTHDIMVERFHGDPSVQSWSLLLDERVPADVLTERPVTESAGTPDIALTPPPPLSGWLPNPRTRQVWAVGNGTLTSFVTADGGGGLRWRDLAVNRWEPDPVRDEHGPWIYLRDEQSGALIGATPEPIGEWPVDARVTFEAASVDFRRWHEGLAIRTRITVASDENVEIREVEIANTGDSPRRIRVVGCLDPVLEPARDFARHPAFSKLFLNCEPVKSLSGVLISRRPRDKKLAPVVFFRIVAEASAEPRVLTTDRGAFLGRYGTAQAPAALTGLPAGAPGPTLDPLCACTAVIELQPGSTHSVAFVTALGARRSDVLRLGQRFGSAHTVRWTFEDSARAASRRVAHLGLSPELLPATQRLLSSLLITDRALRAPVTLLAAGRPAQPRLWGRGISGDDPIVLLRIHSGESTELLDDVLSAHRYLHALGARIDVVLVDEAPTGYADEGAEVVHRMLAEKGVLMRMHQRGGIHVVRTDQMTAEEFSDLAAAARVYLDAHQGSLMAQLEQRPEVPPSLPAFEPAGAPPGTSVDPEVELEVPTLACDNGYGGFDGDEYVVRPDASPPAPWCNVLANEHFGCLTSEAALGSSWSLNAGENRLTPWHNDPVGDPPSEVLYVRDEESARLWSTTPQPRGVPTLVRHGFGYTSYRLVCAGLEQTMTVFVPPDEPLKIVRYSIRNMSSRPRRLTVTYYAEWVLGTRRAETAPYIVPDVSATDACLLAQTSWSVDFAGRVAFLATDRSLHGWTTDRVEMLGRGGSLSQPAALMRWGLSGHIAPGLDPCAALQVHIEIEPQEQTEVHFILGQCPNRALALETVKKLRSPGAMEAAWQRTGAFWDRVLGAVRVHTPDPLLDRLCNGWLPYQVLASRFFGRTAFYQSSGAFGFRDQLQDSLACIHFDAALTRQQLLEAAAHQFVEGDVLHWWHPPAGAGVRTRCSDDLLWLVYVTAEYVAATGDQEVLRERVPLLAGERLGPTEHVRYGRFASTEGVTLLEHCRRAWSAAFTEGPHRLPLIGDGDWNDGMDRVGAGGKGESIWLGWFLYACTERLAQLFERVGDKAQATHCLSRLPPLARALSLHGWDGSWYRRAYYDDGVAIGSAHTEPPHIDSIAQSWAALSGAGEPNKVQQALAAAERTLVRQEDRLVLLLDPPFGLHGTDPGYIAAYPPGVRENGGQYTHAAAWLGWAHAVRGEGGAAHRIAGLLNPLERTRSKEEVKRYRVEPYVLAADVYGQPPFVGRGGWTWYTGAAAWTWRLVIEGILGLKRVDGALEVAPCLPPHFNGFEAWIRSNRVSVHVVVHRVQPDGVHKVLLDGRPIARPRIELTGSGERRLEIWLAPHRGTDATAVAVRGAEIV